MSEIKQEEKQTEDVQFPELVIGLSGALGTDLKSVIGHINQSLHRMHYSCHHIKLSKLMSAFAIEEALDDVDKLDEDLRIEKLMDAGNNFRQSWPDSDGEGISHLAISEFVNIRQKHWEKDDSIQPDEKNHKPIPKTAYIVDSIKHPDEVKFFKRMYGDAFILISVYEPKDIRQKQLIKRFEKSKHGISTVLTKEQKDALNERAEQLMNKDEDENNKFGQSVRKVFHQADLFVSSIYEKKSGLDISKQIDRFFNLLFGAPFITPTTDEYGISLAHSVALKSADLSRQVGAVILTDNGEIISAGCNEVPSTGGSPFWEGENSKRQDTRDYKVGDDASARMKHYMITEVMQELKNGGWLNDQYLNKTAEDLCTYSLYGEEKEESGEILKTEGILKNSRVANIIEFGRIVHAEMSAITDAARRGLSIDGKILYCTTFPCHMCARHILASGIKKVIFIEPYAKSMAADLYKGLMKIDGDKDAYEGAILFEPFIGISPKRFSYLFSMESKGIERKGKNTGLAKTEEYILNDPLLENWNPYASLSERIALQKLKNHLGD
ncbi:MAG: anti-phage dCTP deaminase [Alphaproteobacteria bacterium]